MLKLSGLQTPWINLIPYVFLGVIIFSQPFFFWDVVSTSQNCILSLKPTSFTWFLLTSSVVLSVCSWNREAEDVGEGVRDIEGKVKIPQPCLQQCPQEQQAHPKGWRFPASSSGSLKNIGSLSVVSTVEGVILNRLWKVVSSYKHVCICALQRSPY